MKSLFSVEGLLIIKQRLPLTVLTNHITFASDICLLTESSGDRYGQSRQEKNRHNDKCEYPLERNYLDTELVNSKSYTSLSVDAQQQYRWRTLPAERIVNSKPIV